MLVLPVNLERITTMIADDIGRMLHDKATRGVSLSQDEQAQLDEWYMAQDNPEAAALGVTPPPTLADLQSEVTAALARSISLAQRIQELTDENDALRREIDLLRQQVARRFHSSLHDNCGRAAPACSRASPVRL
jgi:hypothetical protein